MKKILLFSISILFLAACSGDDSVPTGPLPVPDAHLKKITQTQYDMGEPVAINVFNYVNDKPASIFFYNAQEVFLSYTTYHYNDNGLLTFTDTYDDGEQLISNIQYTYDQSGRIFAVNYESLLFSYNTQYAYNPDNTITGSTVGGMTETKTYYLNDSGLVYKEVFGSSVYELTFAGMNPISSQSSLSGTTIFTYDEMHDMSLLNLKSTTGTYKPNAILINYTLKDGQGSTADKYLIKEVSGSTIISHNYTFNEDGLPVMRSDIENGELKSETVYEYEE